MRKDKKSQYQLKKEKLIQIKELIWQRHENWEKIKARTFEGDPNKTPNLMPNDLIKSIWEIVKDER